MFNKKKLLVYPFSAEFSSLLRHKDLMVEYELVNLISPSGWGLSGHDAGNADGGGYIGVCVQADFEEGIKSSDTVLFAESSFNLNFDKYIYPKILKSIELNKNIILTLCIDKNIEIEIRKKCEEKELDFQYCRYDNESISEDYGGSNNILNIDTPVIFVIGMMENINKFEIQLSVGENMTRAGYKISHIGSRAYSNLLGLYSFPQFMFNSNLYESKKIVKFNRFVKEIEAKDKPDAIIIGIPGGIMPINNQFTNNFGILAYEISMAVKPDAAILSLPFSDYTYKQYDEICRFVNGRFGFDITVINLSNIMPEWPKILQGLDFSYSTIDSAYVDSKKLTDSRLKIPIFNIFNKDDCLMLSNHIIDKLAEYGEVNVIRNGV